MESSEGRSDADADCQDKVKVEMTLKRSSTDPAPHINEKRFRPADERKRSGGKVGPQWPLPVLPDDQKNTDRPRLFIPKLCTDENRNLEDDTPPVTYRPDSATPSKPIFTDNDPSFGLPLPVDSPVPFPPSRQNSTNSLVKFSEKLFEDSQGARVDTDDTLSLPDINDGAFPIARSNSSSSESSGIHMRNLSPSESHHSDGFSIKFEADEEEIKETDNNSTASTLELRDSPVEEPERRDIESNEQQINDSRNDDLQNHDLALPSTSRGPQRTKTEVDTELMFIEVQSLLERFQSDGLTVDANDVFLALERYRVAPNRVELVYDEMLTKNLDANFYDELHELIAQYTDIDPEIIRTLMENYKQDSERKQQVISVIRDNAALVHDPVFNDLIHLMKIFPDTEKMTIYAYLKTKQNEPNRVDLVAEILIQNRQETLKTNESMSSIDESKLEFLEEVDELKSIFPDADENYLYDELRNRKNEPNRKEALATTMAELRNYTKADKSKKGKRRRKGKFILSEFVKTFPNAREYFMDTGRPVSEGYKKHVRVYLLNYFTSVKDDFVDDCMTRCQGHLTPAFKVIRDAVDGLSQIAGSLEAAYEVFSDEPRTEPLPYPDHTDQLFYRELQYLDHEDEISNYVKAVSREKERARESAKQTGDLMECQCCYDDEVLFEDMQACEDGHLFCVQCIRMSAETSIGEGKCRFPCLGDDCESYFPLTVLKQLISADTLNKVLQRLQEEEVRLADITNLVRCPFCPFATIMDNEDDKVLHCQNPECLKESCRLCAEPNHVPLSCEEAKNDSTDMRTFIEKRVTEAMIRVCHSCNKRFYKYQGCNKITCSCGATMCYVCKQPAICYDHFEQSPDCANVDDAAMIHQREMEEAGRRAYEEYVTSHPECAGKFDYQEFMKGLPTPERDRDEDEYSDEDEDEFMDDY